MLWKSAGFGAYALLFALSCAHNVPQDVASGPDAKSKGAKPIVIDNGAGKASGIVTYPGGDRVDWKMVELPAKKQGQLDLKLQWTPPRPGLQLAFDVFDEWNTPIVQSKKAGKKSKSHVRTATVDQAKGKYFIRVYAVGRGDAGKYKLTVDFKETSGAMAIDLTKVEIPEPPKLAAIPEPEIACDEFQFDIKNPACKAVCPQAGAPPGWPGCAGKCPAPADINNQACWATMECPNPPDRRVKKCPPSKWPKCDLKTPDPGNPNCDNATADPVTGKVIKNEVQGSDVLITISAGTDQGVGAKGWKGHVLRGDSDTSIDGGEVTVIRVGKRETVGKVHLTTDQISANPRVKLTPPPK